MNCWYESEHIGASKSKFIPEQIENLRHWMTRNVFQPIHNKVDMNSILNINASKTRKEETSTPVYWYSQLLSQHVVSQK
jgi:hypothetical protein